MLRLLVSSDSSGSKAVRILYVSFIFLHSFFESYGLERSPKQFKVAGLEQCDLKLEPEVNTKAQGIGEAPEDKESLRSKMIKDLLSFKRLLLIDL